MDEEKTTIIEQPDEGKEKKLEKKRAMELVERTALFDELVPGFKVWNFYTGDEYGTSVTQGTARISPNTLIRSAKKKLVDARDEAISERDQLGEGTDYKIEIAPDKQTASLTILETAKFKNERIVVAVK